MTELATKMFLCLIMSTEITGHIPDKGIYSNPGDKMPGTCAKGGIQDGFGTLRCQCNQQRVSRQTHQSPQETAAKVSRGGVLEPVGRELQANLGLLSWRALRRGKMGGRVFAPLSQAASTLPHSQP